MRLLHLKNRDIDRQLWDKNLLESPWKKITFTSWFLDLACPGWDAFVSDDHRMMFAVPHRSKAGISYVYPPFFIQQMGLLSPGEITPETTELFLEAIRKKFRRGELYLHAGHTSIPETYETEGYINLELPLNEPYASVSAAYSDNLKRILHKNNETEINEGDFSVALPLINLFRANRGKNVSTLRENDYNRLLRIMNEAFERGYARVFYTGPNAKKPASGAIFLEFGNRSLFFFSATNDTARKERHMHQLIDRYIHNCSNRPVILDFEGSSDEGLARFYSGFGASEAPYFLIRFGQKTFLIKTLLKLRPMLKKTLL